MGSLCTCNMLRNNCSLSTLFPGTGVLEKSFLKMVTSARIRPYKLTLITFHSPYSTDKAQKASKVYQTVTVHLLLRQVCENNLIQPNRFRNFQLRTFLCKKHTKIGFIKSHLNTEESDKSLNPEYFLRMLFPCFQFQVLVIIFSATFA